MFWPQVTLVFEFVLEGSYTGGKITYTDPKTEEDVVFSVGEQSRPLELNEKADNPADAERILMARIANANHGLQKLSFSVQSPVNSSQLPSNPASSFSERAY